MVLRHFVAVSLAIVGLSAHGSGVSAHRVQSIYSIDVEENNSTSQYSIVENDFLPADQNIGDCISALPQPGCGSEAQGGWRQGLVLVLIVSALAFIAWRIVASSKRAHRDA